jgi:O-antigen ligase
MIKNFIINDNYKFLIYLIPFSFIIGQSAISINLILISIIVLLILKFDYINFKKVFDLNSQLLLIFFLLTFVIQIIQFGVNGLKFFFFFKFIALVLILKYYFLKRDYNLFLDKYFKNIIYIFLFVFIDLIYQKIFGVDIFGFKSTEPTALNRLTGPFGNNEYIPGSFIFHICGPAIIYFVHYYKKKQPYNFLFILTLINLFLIGIFITGERISFLLSLLSIFILFVIEKKLRKKLLLSLAITFLIIFFISKKDNYFIERYDLFKQTLLSGAQSEHSLKSNFFDSQWGAHYLTSIEIFKKNFLFGSGVRSFRIECQKKEYDMIISKSKDIRCSTHPHNFYLEILSETGILSFALFLALLAFTIYNSAKLLYLGNKSFILISFFIVFLSILWPLRSTGSIFSNFGGSMMWLNFAFLFAINSKLNKFYKINN